MTRFHDRSLAARYWRTRSRIAWIVAPEDPANKGWRRRLACWVEPGEASIP